MAMLPSYDPVRDLLEGIIFAMGNATGSPLCSGLRDSFVSLCSGALFDSYVCADYRAAYAAQCDSPHADQLTAAAICCVIAALCGCLIVLRAAEKLRISPNLLSSTACFICVGVVVGGAWRALAAAGVVASSAADLSGLGGRLYFKLLVPLLCLDAGCNGVANHALRRNFRSLAAMSSLGTLLSVSIVAALLYFASPHVVADGRAGLPLAECVIFASLIASLDVSACMAAFESSGVSPAVIVTVVGESQLNDVTATTLYTAFLADINTPAAPSPAAAGGSGPLLRVESAEIAGGFVASFVVSIALGYVASLVAALLLKHVRPSGLDEGPAPPRSGGTAPSCDLLDEALPSNLHTCLFLLLALVPYYVAQALSYSGICASLVFCLVARDYALKNVTPSSVAQIRYISRFAGALSEATLFCFLGAQLVLTSSYSWSPGLVLLALGAVAVARAAQAALTAAVASLYRCVTDRRCSRGAPRAPSFGDDGAPAVTMLSARDFVLVWAAGVRGAVPFALASAIPPFDGVTHRGSHYAGELLAMTAAVVLVSNLVLGLATIPLISCLRPSSRGEERVGNAATSSSSLLERDAARRRSRYALASTSGLLGRAWQAFSEGASDFLLVKD